MVKTVQKVVISKHGDNTFLVYNPPLSFENLNDGDEFELVGPIIPLKKELIIPEGLFWARVEPYKTDKWILSSGYTQKLIAKVFRKTAIAYYWEIFQPNGLSLKSIIAYHDLDTAKRAVLEKLADLKMCDVSWGKPEPDLSKYEYLQIYYKLNTLCDWKTDEIKYSSNKSGMLAAKSCFNQRITCSTCHIAVLEGRTYDGRVDILEKYESPK
jgi:hypothetical protein